MRPRETAATLHAIPPLNDTWGAIPGQTQRAMDEISIEQARTDLRTLVERVAGGETILIVEDGKPMATLSPARSSVAGAAPQRLGFLAGAFSVPEDFDRLGEREIAGMFGDAS